MQNYTQLKDQGNAFFKEKKFTSAIEIFQSAINLVISQQPLDQINNQSELGKLYVILNINAAFAALNLKTKQHYAKADKLCNVALEIDPNNQKGLYRRSLANKQLAELIEIESKGSSEELLALYNKAKKDLEDLIMIDRNNQIAKQKLSEVVKNIYRVNVTQGKDINLSSSTKVEQVKSQLKKVQTKVEPVKPKKTGDMNKIMKDYKIEQVTSIARQKIHQYYLTQELPKNICQLEKAIREVEKSKDVYLKFIYRLTDEYLKKIQPTFDMLFKMIEVVQEQGEGQQAKLSLWTMKQQKIFDLLWKGYTSNQKQAFRQKWQSLGLDLTELK